MGQHERSRRNIILVTAAICTGCFWFVNGLGGAPAQAQIPDSGAQLQMIIAELQQLNKQAAELRELAKQTRDALSADAKKPGGKTEK